MILLLRKEDITTEHTEIAEFFLSFFAFYRFSVIF